MLKCASKGRVIFGNKNPLPPPVTAAPFNVSAAFDAKFIESNTCIGVVLY